MSDRIIRAGPVKTRGDGREVMTMLFVYNLVPNPGPITLPPSGPPVPIQPHWALALANFQTESNGINAGTHVAREFAVELAEDDPNRDETLQALWRYLRPLTIKQSTVLAARGVSDEAQGAHGVETPVT